MKIVLACHGRFGEGLLNSLRWFVGDLADEVSIISLEQGVSPQEFYETALEQVAAEGETLFLCDMFGGTPFNICNMVMSQRQSVGVYYGVNLAILIEIVGNKDEMDMRGLFKYMGEIAEKTFGYVMLE